jgi:hypothetical protein
LGWGLFPNPIGGFPVGGTTRWEPNPWEPKTQPRLKEFVKDKLTRINRPDNLVDIIKSAIRIKNRFYKRSLGKKGSYNFRKKQGNRKKK